MQKIIILVLLFYSSLVYSQKTIELLTFDCKSGNTSTTDIKRTEFKILTKHELVIDKTKYWSFQYIFKTNEPKVKVEFKNIYKQKLDTVFQITENNQQIYLCVDKFKDYNSKSLITKALEKRNNWNLKMTVAHCFGRNNSKLEIIPKKNKILAKYIYWEYPENSNRKKKFVVKKTISEQDIVFIETFEKQMKLMNRPKGDCTNHAYYYLKVGDEEIKIEESSCSGFDETELLTKLGIK
ncbi:hypothetical protein [Algibacter sp. R77976]|uniref:hypothetical protein n=1 Tax=Algibacter sp. R77976 TaxID=3093873 RepID=UPI0037CA6B11